MLKNGKLFLGIGSNQGIPQDIRLHSGGAPGMKHNGELNTICI